MQQNDATGMSTVTLGPIQGSTKTYRPVAGYPDLKIPVRRIRLSNGEHLDLYDTSGPYTDDRAVIDLDVGLPPTRESWSHPEPVEGAATQIVWARAGQITPEMAYVAERERCAGGAGAGRGGPRTCRDPGQPPPSRE